jgi:transposase
VPPRTLRPRQSQSAILFSADIAIEIHTEAKELIAMLPTNPLSKVMVQEAITQLNTTSKTGEVFRAEMNRLAQELPEYDVVMKMYGTGPSLGPQLMAEIGMCAALHTRAL